MAKRKVKKKKIKFKRILIFLLFLALITLVALYIRNIKITNIIVKGNTMQSDWEIIKEAKLDKYPKVIENFPPVIKQKLEKSPYISKAKVKNKTLTTIEIKIEENKPLFYYVPNQKTVLSDKKEVDDNYPVPTLLNYVPDKLYGTFIEKMKKIDYPILKRISEIKYDPNDVDEERFLITMNDGNYVYLTLNKFTKINHYVEIIKEFNNKKGVLYLDSGEYFKVFGQ